MKKIILFAAAALALSSCTKELSDSGSVNGGNGPAVEDNDVFPGWVRIKLSADASPLNVGEFTRSSVNSGNTSLDAVAAKMGATEIRRVYSDGGKYAERRRKYGLHLWYDLKIDDSIPVTRAQAEVEAVPGVAVAYPIYKIHLSDAKYVPEVSYSPASDNIRPTVDMPFDDPELNKQWHYYNDGSLKNAVAGADINLFKCWDEITTGSPDITVAVIDMGVDYKHPDLAANMWINKGEIPGNGIDDDNNGYIDDIYGWNYADTNTSPKGSGNIDPGYHGTHIAGTISAVNNNGIGVCGVAGGSGNNDGVRLMTVGMYKRDGSGVTPSGDMFAYAAENGAVIASCSWELNIAMPQDLLEGMTYFYETAGTDENGVQTGPVKGGTLIFAAGNSGLNSLKLPGKLDMCISVAAMRADYLKATYSNYSSEVDIMAPGGENGSYGNSESMEKYRIYSTLPNDKYGYLEGTSMATPHVSGIAALIASVYKGQGFTNAMLREKLLASYRTAKVEPQFANGIGVGMIDASMIGIENPNAAPGAITNAKATGLPDNMTISCTAPSDANGMPIAGYILEYRGIEGSGAGEQWTTVNLINNVEIGETYEYTFPLTQLTKYSFKMTPYDRFGSKGSAVTFEGTVLEHINKVPVLRSKFMDVEIADAKDKYVVRRYNLTDYFRDPDAAYGDKLTFVATASTENVVIITMEENGNRLVLNPVCQGSTVITIKATDKKGLFVEGTFKYSVLKGECGTIPPPPTPPVVERIAEGLYLYPNPVESTVNVRIGGEMKAAVADMRIIDAAGREIMKDKVTLDEYGMGPKDLSSLAPGVYTVIMTSDGKRYVETIVKK